MIRGLRNPKRRIRIIRVRIVLRIPAGRKRIRTFPRVIPIIRNRSQTVVMRKARVRIPGQAVLWSSTNRA